VKVMTENNKPLIDIALIHHPVLGRNKEIIGSAITNLDLHDIARTARTYGVGNYYIVTPYADQQKLVAEIIGHWQEGHGSTYNPARKEAFNLVKLAASLDEVMSDIGKNRQGVPMVVTTSAVTQKKSLSFRESRQRIESGEPTLLLFGTAHGLAPELTEKADYTLPAIVGPTDYNHLSVRAAVAIICDRLLG
jgi:hypothetical protein